MIKIIAGEYGSRNLKTLNGDNTRPTSIKIRGAVFNRLQNKKSKNNFLDLFAGSGAFGIEALSRGFTSCCFVDNNSKAIEIIKENCKIIKNKQFKIIKSNYKEALKSLSEEKFDCIFLDPPYNLKIIEEILLFVSDNDMLNNETDVICETLKEDYLSEKVGNLIKIKEVIYGITKITYYKKETDL